MIHAASLYFIAGAFPANALPLFFSLSILHGVVSPLFIMLLVTIYQLDALGAVVSELKLDQINVPANLKRSSIE